MIVSWCRTETFSNGIKLKGGCLFFLWVKSAREEVRAWLDLPALLLAGFLLAGVSTIALADRPDDLPPPPPDGVDVI